MFVERPFTTFQCFNCLTRKNSKIPFLESSYEWFLATLVLAIYEEFSSFMHISSF